MLGHAVANVTPVAAANRVGVENGQVFYGTSFICDHAGDMLNDMDRVQEGVVTGLVDLDEVDRARAAWGFFRDRRTDLYGAITAPLSDKG
jgi:N-carbamoylputrescine amidase